MTPEQLPSFSSCANEVSLGDADALAYFIYHHEPSEPDRARLFRERLAALIREAEFIALTRARAPETLPAKSDVDVEVRASDTLAVVSLQVSELERRLDTMSRALAGVEAMNRRLLELERMHGLTIARAH